MPLSPSKLASNLADWMMPFRQGLSQAADDLAAQYDSYALDAIDVTGDNPAQVFPGKFASVVKNNWKIGDTFLGGAQVIEDAVQAYWKGGTFKLENPPSGVVTETTANVIQVPPDGSIAPPLATIYSTYGSISEYSKKWADVIHAGTILTIVYNEGTTAVGSTVTAEGVIE